MLGILGMRPLRLSQTGSAGRSQCEGRARQRSVRERSAGTVIIPRTVPGGLGETRGIPRGETEEEEIARSGLIVLFIDLNDS